MKFFQPFQHLAVPVMTLLGGAAVPHIGQTAEFTLMPSPQTVHIGHFASNLKPVLSIESGDTVTIETAMISGANNDDVSIVTESPDSILSTGFRLDAKCPMCTVCGVGIRLNSAVWPM